MNSRKKPCGTPKSIAEDSSRQFQVQLSHFDAGLGRSDMLAIHAGEQAIASKDFAVAAQTQANNGKESLQSTIDNFHQEQRAWVGIAAISMTSEGISIRLVNSGRLATNFTTTVDRMIANVLVNKDTPFGAIESLYTYGGGGALLPPNGHYDISVPIGDLSNAEKTGLQSNTRVIYVRGNVRFSTGFGSIDNLSFCFVWNQSHPLFNSCPPLHAQLLKDKGQDIDDTPKQK